MREFDLLIIGGGVAALTVAEELRRENHKLSICIVSDEELYPYYRLRLADYMFKEIDDRFFIKPREWFSANNINIFLKSRILDIDFDKKTVYTSDKELYFNTCVIASGSNPNIFNDIIKKDFKDRVFFFRSYEDLQRLKLVLNKIKVITIVGAGLLGLELASQLKKHKIYLVETAPRLLPKQLDHVGSFFLEQNLRQNDTELFLNSSVEDIFQHDDKLEIHLSSQQTITSDIIIFSAGVQPNIDFIKEKLKINQGILVDSKMRTNIKNIFACGDVANLGNFRPGTWSFAVDSAKVVAKNIAGYNEEYIKKDYPYFLKAFNTTIISIGNPEQLEDVNVYEFIDQNNFIYKKILLKDRILSGYILINDLNPHNELFNFYMKEIDIKILNKYLQ